MIAESSDARESKNDITVGEPSTNGHKPGPIPLTQAIKVPPFPVDALPETFASMVCNVAEATQTDPAMAGTSALAALSACTGGYAKIEVRQGWREQLNIYTVTVADVAERKSSVQEAMVSPIHDVEKQMAEAAKPVRAAAEARKDIAVNRAKKLRSDAAKAKDDAERDDLVQEAIAATAWANAIIVPPYPRIIADDITPEETASMLHEHGGRLAIFSTEGGIFDIMAGRYSKSPNLDVYLKAHSGDSLIVDRKGGTSEHIERPALTIGLMIQPSVLSAIAEKREFHGRGLLARFLYAHPTSKVGYRKIAPAPVPELVKQSYATAINDLALGLAENVMEPAVVKFDVEAQKWMDEIETNIEPSLRPGGSLDAISGWGGKYTGVIARLAGILHFARHGIQGTALAICSETLRDAARLGEYYRFSAINAFIQMGIDETTADAQYLLKRIRHLGLKQFSTQELHNKCQSRFPKAERLLRALNLLSEHGYLTPLPKAPPTGGRPKSPEFCLLDVDVPDEYC